MCDLLPEIKSFLKQIDFLCEDVENECLYFFYLKTIFNNYESIDISQFVNFIKKLIFEFEVMFVSFKKV